MIAVGDVALLRPWWLLALPIVVALYFVSRPRGVALGGWAAATDPHLLAAMVARGASGVGTRMRAPAVLATIVIGLLSLAGPALRQQGQDRLRNLDATVIVMDVSSQMTAHGLLRDGVIAAHDLLDHISARQAGLVVYAGDAYVASALTDFTDAIDKDLFALGDETVPDPGVRPDRGLVLAGKMLDEAHIIQGDIVLITAGGGLEGSAAIRASADLAAHNRRVYVMAPLGKDTRGGDQAVAAVVNAGGGFAVDFVYPGRLFETLQHEAISRTGSSVINALNWLDLGRPLLALAAFPMLLGFRKEVSA